MLLMQSPCRGLRQQSRKTCPASLPLSRAQVPGGTPVAVRRSVATAAQKQQFASFEDLINGSELPVLVDFYAVWCGPCQMMSQVLQQIARRLKGGLKVVKIDTDKYPAIASQHRIQALPTVCLFVNGKVVLREEGLLPEHVLLARVQQALQQHAVQGKA